MSNPNSSWATPKYRPSNQMRSMAINVTSPLKKIRRKFRSARTADQNARLAGTFQQGKPDMARHAAEHVSRRAAQRPAEPNCSKHSGKCRFAENRLAPGHVFRSAYQR